jgi:DNA-binding CsgD family transcriptional regulator
MRRGRPPYPDLLTPREQEVLGLLRDGLTNQQIADRLNISESGARYHVSDILTKLGVSSREDAARWRPGRPVFGAGFLIALRRLQSAAGRTATAAPIVLAAALGLALIAGVAVMSSRGGGDSDLSPAATSDVEQPAAIREMRDLADEVTQTTRSLLPGAELIFVAYNMPNGPYTFRFAQPGSRAEVTILGPNSGAGRWEAVREERPAEFTALEPLDISNVRSSFREVAEAAASERIGLSTGNMGLVLFSEPGELTWNVMAALQPGLLVRCQAPDAGLASMTCDEPLPAGGTYTSRWPLASLPVTS